MSRHQIRLLLCSTASIALIASALFAFDWFRLDIGTTRVSLDARTATMCMPDGTCRSTGLRGLGAYHVLATGAFWNGIILALLVLGQCGMNVFTGAASSTATRIGYAVGSITLLCAFAAGYLFAPEFDRMLGDVMGSVVTRTLAPAMLVAGSLLGILAVRYAQLEEVNDDVGEYKPVIVRKDGAGDGRLPVTPISGISRLPDSPPAEAGRPRMPSSQPIDVSARTRAASESGLRTRTPSQQVERIPLPGHAASAGNPSGRTKSPSEPGRPRRAASESGLRTRTPSQQVERIPLPGHDRTKSPSQPGRPARAPTDPGMRTRTPSQQVERIALPGSGAASPDPAVRTKSPSQPGERTQSPSQQIERIPLPGSGTSTADPGMRSRSPSQQIERIALPGSGTSTADPGGRTKSPSQPGMRSRSPSQPFERIALPGSGTSTADPGGRTKAPSEPGMRSRSPSQQFERIPLPGSGTSTADPGGRTKSPSEPGTGARSGSQQPLVARTKSPSQQPLMSRTSSQQQPATSRTSSQQQPATSRTSSQQQPATSRTSSQQQPATSRTSSQQQPGSQRARAGSEPPDDGGIDIPSRARTSSSGPIDIAARLSGAPIAVAIKPPLPEPVPVPPDQIPVAPESGLVIRKRTPSAAPLSPGQIPVSPESGLVIRKKPPSPQPQPAAPAFGSAGAPASRGATGITPPGAMPSIELRSVDPDIDNPFAPPVQSQLPAQQDEAMSGLALGRSPTPGGRGSSNSLDAGAEPAPMRSLTDPAVARETDPVITRAFTPQDKPAALRGKLKYAVNMATLSSMGITAVREDGTTKHVGWDDIIGIIARRLPAEPPYDGATFVDLVSNAGSTLRILPWTRLDGAPLRGDGEERARGIVQLIAARCLDAKLDSWTKVFADGAGHAAQLPSAQTLAAHDDKLA